MTVGRDRANRLHLRDRAVSRHHCVVEPDPDGYHLRDLDSLHGTFVNGVPVHERPLEAGDLITLGGSLLLFQHEAEEPVRESTYAEEREPVTESTVHIPLGQGFFSRADILLASLPPQDRTARDLHTLLRIGEALLSLRATAPLAHRLLELLLETVPAERAALVLFDSGSVETVASFFLDRRGSIEPFPVSRTLVQKMAAQPAAMLVNGVIESGAWKDAKSLEMARVQSLALAPLITPERLLGAIYLDTRRTEVQFDQRHLELLAAIAGIASTALANARHVEWLEQERRRLEDAIDHDLIGESPHLREIWRLIARAAPTDATVLIRGESGTGKEVAARALHRASRRNRGPFVAVNCATLSETLLESELFGHEKGAFTGALLRKAGKFELAHGGTLFLDEIGEIPLALQARLLRALQEREIDRVGGTRPVKVDVRVIAATNRDLEKGRAEGSFREDLFYRLDVISFTMPPLRERPEDIPLLASHFAAVSSHRIGRRVAGFSSDARACLLRYSWPGNVRELANAVERAVVLGEGDLIQPEDLPETVLEAAPRPTGLTVLMGYHDALNATKRRLILDAVERCGGNITRAAERLGLHPNYLHRLIKNLDLRGQLPE
jgi:transcriptional regulator with GAF, ATPase, and Fis domain